MSEELIRVRALAKKFSRNPLGLQKNITRRVFAALFHRRLKGKNLALEEGEFWALKDVSFSVRRGEALGIIGHNGAGKTTLLNILSSYSTPDNGSAEHDGRLVSLINLSNGLIGTLSGRENIYTRGTLNGLTHKEIAASEADIIDFAELGDAIDAPFKTYSSGMKMRLAFSINIHSRADVFLIDEVLSVGDMAFRNKCYEHFQSLKGSTAMILVSHSMSDIERFCDKAVFLDSGQVQAQGAPADVIDTYQKAMLAKKEASIGNVKTRSASLGSSHGEEIEAQKDLLKLDKVSLNGNDMNKASVLVHGEKLLFEASFWVKGVQQDLNLALVFYKGGIQMFNLETNADGFIITQGPEVDGWRPVILTCAVDALPLVSGTFTPVLVIHDGPKYLMRQPLGAVAVEKDKSYRFGEFSVPKKWHTS